MSELPEPFHWRGCSRQPEGCRGAPVAPFGECWEHLAGANLDQALEALRPGAKLDLRGTAVSSTLLEKFFDVLRDDEGEVVFGETWFLGTEFLADVRFERCRFQGLAYFNASHFAQKAGFIDAEFDEGADFSTARFDDITSFEDVHFKKESHFDRAMFASRVFFTSVEFDRLASFMYAQFGEVELNNGPAFLFSTFRSLVNFDGARLLGYAASFMHTKFERHASFRATAFGLRSIISSTSLPEINHFGPIYALGILSINDVTFPEAVTVEVSATNLVCIDSKFPQGASFRCRWAQLTLDRSVFGGPSTIASVARFRAERTVYGSRDDDREPNPGLEEQRELFTKIEQAMESALEELMGEGGSRVRLVSLREVDVSNIELIDVDLGQCLFVGAYHLDQLGIEGYTAFAQTPRRTYLRRGLPPIWRWTRRQVLAEERWWRSSVAGVGGLNAPSSLQKIGWQEVAFTPPDWLEGHGAKPPERSEPARLASTYRSLRKAQEDRKNEPGAADFYYGEMEMRRLSGRTPLAERFILSLYWLFAGYGLRGTRALVALAVVIVTAGLALDSIGIPAAEAAGFSFWESVIYAAGASVSVVDEGLTLTTWGQVLRICLRLLGPLLLGLALLSVRNRVKR